MVLCSVIFKKALANGHPVFMIDDSKKQCGLGQMIDVTKINLNIFALIRIYEMRY